jgi:hypothetical protein
MVTKEEENKTLQNAKIVADIREEVENGLYDYEEAFNRVVAYLL